MAQMYRTENENRGGTQPAYLVPKENVLNQALTPTSKYNHITPTPSLNPPPPPPSPETGLSTLGLCIAAAGCSIGILSMMGVTNADNIPSKNFLGIVIGFGLAVSAAVYELWEATKPRDNHPPKKRR